MKIINVPGDFPAVKYYFLGNTERNDFLGKIISLSCPRSSCAGYINSINKIDGKDSAFYVLTDPFWMAQSVNLPEEIRKKLILFPVPEKDYWSYWQLLKWLVGKIDGSGNVPEKIFLNYLVSLGRAVPRDRGWAEYGLRFFLLRRGLRLRRKGYSGISRYIPWVDKYGRIYKGYFLKGNYPFLHTSLIKKHSKEINYVRDFLSDAQSRQAYEKILYALPEVLWKHYIKGCLNSLQYFEYLNINGGDVIINCGVHCGSEIPLFLASLGQGQIHHIDPSGFDYLSDYAASWVANYKSINIEHKIALGDTTGKIMLSNRIDGQAAEIEGYSSEKSSEYSCIRPDDFVSDNGLTKIDIIKMDIEGFEEKVVPLLSGVIKKYRPQLAVSIYHKTAHLWDLPLQLIKMCKDYYFYLNFYSSEQYEVIFYCIPREKKISNIRRESRLDIIP